MDEEKNNTQEYAPIEEGVFENFLALLPLKNVVLLPKSILPVIVGRTSSIKAVEFALKHHKHIFVTAQKNPDIEQPKEHDVFAYGTRASILQVMRMPNGSLKILIEGLCRSQITEMVPYEDFLGVYYEDIATHYPKKNSVLMAGWRTVKDLYQSYAKLNDKIPQDLMLSTDNAEDIDFIVDTVAVHVNLTFTQRQELLEIKDLEQRMLFIAQYLKQEVDILEIEQRIKGRIQTQVEKNQREYYLNEQIKAIHKELGREDQQGELLAIKETLKNLKPPKEVIDKVEKEVKRLEQMPPFSSEAVVSRHYIDWIISLPWHKTSKDRISLAQAEKILDKQHAGLKKVKERVIEFLAAKKFSKTLERSPILCLVGPPGVGKTSLARSISESLGREFVRISLGGVKDEAEIRGHRRTYIGALPGKIIQAMKKASTVNPVILLDEIDKMSMDIHGDPASALLEVLDPEQNKTFVDHFLDVEYDLSKVMFVATANMIDSIPYPLFDRMEVISLSGYTDEEKLQIARKFLISKNLTEYSLTEKQCKFDDTILKHIITSYTKEAGVRQLERVIAKIMRKAIQVLLKDKKTTSIVISDERIKEWLGNPHFRKSTLSNSTNPGLATGLAWTELGGDVLEIEVAILPGKGNTTLTGQLGDVMQESAHAALSYIRSRSSELELPKNFHSNKDIHIHLPEGSTPKDGPSAGITMCTALVSALTHVPIKEHLAMTGEITLRGRVLAIGGVKEKLLAAQQYGIKTVIMPEENKEDVEDVLKDITLTLEIKFVKNMDEVLSIALQDNLLPKKSVAKKTTQKRKSR